MHACVLGWSEQECACIRACISACCMLLLAVNGFCGVCVSAALLSAYLCLMHVRVLPACSVEQKKKQRGALHHRRREREYERDVREEVCAGSEMRINVRKEQSEGVRVKSLG